MTASALANGFPPGFRALVIGASGAIGAAMVAQLRADPACAEVLALHRQSTPAIDFEREDSIEAAAAELAAQAPFHLIINAAGLLHTPDFMPEKKLGDIDMAQMLDTFRVNTFGPALLLRHFSRLLDRRRGVLALLSAKVGSIEDNRLGGWYSYRASKAALNMFVKTAAIELRRSQPQAVVVALHPGTVNSRLSQPFRGAEIGRAPEVAAAEMLAVLAALTPADSGRFVSYDGQRLPW
jgi:NAD(P)-dependent dehydrogenase (short-subunit alcohol dehydrogenase family)